MSHHIIRLEFKSAVRVGEVGIGLEGVTPLIHSDTLFSALCHTWALIQGGDWVTQMLESYEARKPFVVSSCFPYRGADYYVPRPYSPLPRQAAYPADAYKVMKTLRWIGVASLSAWLDGGQPDLTKMAQENQEAQSTDTYSLAPGVGLDRVDQKSQLYFRGYRTFEPGAGLYFILRLDDESYEPLLRGALELLGENGLGSERNNGYGRFLAHWQDAAVLQPLLDRQGERSYLLSLYHPQNPKIDAENNFFALEERRGWFYSPSAGRHMKRKSVWMFAEGSVFNEAVSGRLVEVSPDEWPAQNHHKIIRCGVPLTIKF